MPVPILKQHRVLIASVQNTLTDSDMLELQNELAVRVGRFQSTGVIIDVSVVDVLDSFACRMLRTIAQVIRLRGAQAIIVGIQPDVAFAMVQLGLTLDDVPTALDLEDGLELLSQRNRRRDQYD
jgi:rsbT antagonist protein RsbS